MVERCFHFGCRPSIFLLRELSMPRVVGVGKKIQSMNSSPNQAVVSVMALCLLDVHLDRWIWGSPCGSLKFVTSEAPPTSRTE